MSVNRAFRLPLRNALVGIGALLLAATAIAANPASALELIMFGKNGCVWCARWEREVGRAYPEAEEAQIAPLRRLDIREQDGAGLELQEPVIYTPTFVLVDEGAEVGRITGYQSESEFWARLDDMLPQRQQR